jgi:hypothetical protein
LSQITQKWPPKLIIAEKIEGRKMTGFGEKWQKRGWEMFLQAFIGDKI